MSLLDLFGIKEDAKKSDVVRNAPEIEGRIEQTNKALQDILNENPDLVNNLQTNIATAQAPVGPMKIESPISKAYDFLMQGRVTNPFDLNNKLGILDLVNTGRFFSNPTFSSAIFSPFAPLAIKGITGLVRNIQNPSFGTYTDVFGNLNKQTKEAIEKENLRDFYDRYDRGEVDFTGGITSAQDKARGDKSRNGGSGGSGAHGMEGRAAGGYEDL
tara:strand:- start:40 stop:684 length:645 start_codon:yes stop_codon:yes gene_type:complete